jgi:hypothetical protein
LSEGDNDKVWEEKPPEDISNMSAQTLSEIRKTFNIRRTQLTKMKVGFAQLANTARGDFERVTEKALAKDIQIMENQYMWLETLLVACFGLKKQVDILKDIVVQLREVNGNPAMKQDLEKAFKDYNLSNF